MLPFFSLLRPNRFAVQKPNAHFGVVPVASCFFGATEGRKVNHDAPLASVFVAEKEIPLEFKGIVPAAADRGALSANQDRAIEILEKVNVFLFLLLFVDVVPVVGNQRYRGGQSRLRGLDDGVFSSRHPSIDICAVVFAFKVGSAQKYIEWVCLDPEARHVDSSRGHSRQQQCSSSSNNGTKHARENLPSMQQQSVTIVATIAVIAVVSSAQ